MIKLLHFFALGYIALPSMSLADSTTRWINLAATELRSEASANSAITYYLNANFPVVLLKEQSEWCHVSSFDRLQTGFVLCNRLANEPLNDMQLFWAAPSTAQLKAAGTHLANQLTNEQQQAEYNTYYEFINALSDDEKQREEPHEVTIVRPANAEFDAMKKSMAKGIKIQGNLAWHYQSFDQLTSDDPNALNGIDSNLTGLLLELIHQNVFPKINPSFFGSVADVLFVGSNASIDDLSVVADTTLKAEVVRPAYATDFHEPTIVGYWDISELKTTFIKPLSVYSLAKNGLVGKAIGHVFTEGGGYGFCEEVMSKLLPDDLTTATDYPEVNNSIVQIYSRNTIQPKVNVRTKTHRMHKLLPNEELTTLHLHSVDLNHDTAVDILVAEGELPSHSNDNTVKFWSMYFVNINGKWYFSNSFVTPECT